MSDGLAREASGVIEHDGGALAWESAAEGPAVVFLHPGLWDDRVWDEQFGVFSRTYRVLRFDFRGYGRSSRPEPGRPYSHVDDLAAVMDAASVERAALVGCSMGGSTAIDFALEYPSRVSALVLASSGMNAFDDRLTPEEEAELELLDAPLPKPWRRATSSARSEHGFGSGLRSERRTRQGGGSARSHSTTSTR